MLKRARLAVQTSCWRFSSGSAEIVELRLDAFERAAAHRKDMAIGLALLETDRRIGPREHPVHGEAIGRPIGPMMPDSAAIPSFGRLIGPCTINSAPGSVRNRQGR